MLTIHRPAARFILGSLAASLVLAACQDGGMVRIRHGSTTRLATSASANRPPVIEQVHVTPGTGLAWILTASASDADGDPLSYDWQAKGGSLQDNHQPTVHWLAPPGPGPYDVSLTVSDGQGGEATWSGQVGHPPAAPSAMPSPGPTPQPAATPTPIETVPMPGQAAGNSGSSGNAGPTAPPFDFPLPSTIPDPAPTPSTLAVGEIDSLGPSGAYTLMSPPPYGFQDGDAADALFNYPYGIAVTPKGTALITDSFNHLVRTVFPFGYVGTLAGSGIPGYSGDGWIAWQAQFNQPHGIAIDQDNNVYVADTGNHAVRLIKPNRQILTYAGTGTPGYSGDAGLAKHARLHTPLALAVDAAGNLYIADSGNHVIRRVDKASGRITTYAGNGGTGTGGDGGDPLAATFAPYGPCGLAVAPNGDLYIADTYNLRVRVIHGGKVWTVAGSGELPQTDPHDGGTFDANLLGNGGPAFDARLYYPRGVYVAPDGDLYIADTGAHQVRKVSGGTITRVAGSAAGVPGYGGDGGSALAAELYSPTSVAISKNLLLIVDWGSHRIRMLQQ